MKWLEVIRKSFTTLRNNDPLILAAATAFFATFSVSPIIVILVNILGLYFQDEDIKNQLISKLESMFGQETSEYVSGIVSRVSSTKLDWVAAAAGFVFLLFVATTLLKVVKQAIHAIWHIRRKHTKQFAYRVRERVTGAGIILFTGLLLVISFLLDTSVTLLSSYIDEQFDGTHVFFIRLVNLVFSMSVTTVWFTSLFKVLPDARVDWGVAWTGGFFTAALFSIGKWLLGKLLLFNSLAQIFGPSASFVLILLFIFYSSFILYFGAAFTAVYAKAKNKPIHAGKWGESYELKFLRDEE